jgi:hypothetical protein
MRSAAEPEPDIGERNRPEVVVEVLAAFRRYEQALTGHDLATLRASFIDHPDVVRYGVADRQRGAEALARWRSAQPALPAGRTLSETVVTTYGSRVGIVTTLFRYPGRPWLGRQSQTWLRTPAGWRIVHAHVSEIADVDDARGG